ncbi:hypothetical protein [Bifidobacterium parmae]|uniref:Uncharacterized protein n=1 Tax=Bifidobacterium parmae TaxID=361854 RepID=A0A2N5J414_9BIFI|nr:hypothetical protein [Bifidobacterium parmae]PLS28960.1 hypothetical protein Uis4E_0897 [Bifidobacterium parmae]
MHQHIRHIIMAIIGVIALLMAPAAMADEPTQPNEPEFIQVGPTLVESSLNIHTEQELTDFLLSSTPKDVWEDVDTGTITKVALHQDTGTPYIDYQSYCDTFTLCLMTPSGADVAGFKNAGIRAGRWGNVGQWRTLAIGGGQIRYSQNGHYVTTAKRGPWTWNKLSGTVDVVRVQIWD